MSDFVKKPEYQESFATAFNVRFIPCEDGSLLLRFACDNGVVEWFIEEWPSEVALIQEGRTPPVSVHLPMDAQEFLRVIGEKPAHV